MAEKQTKKKNKIVGNEKNVEGEAGGEAATENLEFPELGPFETITGQRMPSAFFKFHFKNVEYSSGRHKTFLCYSVEKQGKECERSEGYVEDEHAGTHAEKAFFTDIFTECDGSLRYSIIWYVSSSPCTVCAAKIAEYLSKCPNVELTIFMARLFMWEEAEIHQGLRQLQAAGCRLRIMKGPEYNYCWNTYVDNEGEAFTPWEDLQDSCTFYEEKLHDILQHA
ncbi:C-_U-editing enzyme APOBEC-2a [Rhincodon typus]|uniref:C->U-editing enzyme APOBEC-2a n=1 Tax=Rhincodon typus TaxID=259920 RepID=UPI0020309855|nr:C->U-editing enzyme APOBEC-2a [Rhincodon typus]